jgi:hypothetical protein
MPGNVELLYGITCSPGAAPGSPTEGQVYYDSTAHTLRFRTNVGWADCGGSGGTSMGSFGSTPNANGGTITSGVLYLQPADGTYPGGVSTTTQSFAGAKTFNSAATAVSGISSLGTGIYGSGVTGISASGTTTGLSASGGTYGVYASTTTGIGVSATSSGTGAAIYGYQTLTGEVTRYGVHGNSDADYGSGVYGEGKYGVTGVTSSATGYGGDFTAATGGNAIRSTGNISLAGANTPVATAISNKVTPDNVAKAYGRVHVTWDGDLGAIVTVVDGFNVAAAGTLISSNNQVQLELLGDMASTTGTVLCSWWGIPLSDIPLWTHGVYPDAGHVAFGAGSGASMVNWGDTLSRSFTFVVFGRQ